MPFQKNGVRDYRRELEWEHEYKPNRAKDRSARNKARRDLDLEVGDGKHADHITPLVNGGGKGKSNLRAVSAKTNLKKEAARKKREAR
jgi:hypothetical protein